MQKSVTQNVNERHEQCLILIQTQFGTETLKREYFFIVLSNYLCLKYERQNKNLLNIE